MATYDIKSIDSPLDTSSTSTGTTLKTTTTTSVHLLRQQLSQIGLDSRGNRQTLTKRLKNYIKSIKNSTSSFNQHHLPHNNRRDKKRYNIPPNNPSSEIDYLLVFDVEATCHSTKTRPDGFEHEIIEFPIVLMNAKSGEILDEFHSFVCPEIDPILSDFCVDLTGIQQSQVDDAPNFVQVLELFQSWLSSHKDLHFSSHCEQFDHKIDLKISKESEELRNQNGPKKINISTVTKSLSSLSINTLIPEQQQQEKSNQNDSYNFIFITHGPFDIQRFVFKQCELSNIELPDYFENWLDIKRIVKKQLPSKRRKQSLEGLINYFGLTFEGRLHSGIDDARNMARIIQVLIQRNVKLAPFSSLKTSKRTRNG